MVFRALIVGWVLVLGSWCWGQEERPIWIEPGPLEYGAPNSMGVERLPGTEAIEVDGQKVWLVLHRSWFRSRVHGERVWSGPGYVLTAVPADGQSEAAIVWIGRRMPISMRDPGAVWERSAFWWDSAANQLWIGIANCTSKEGNGISVNRLEFARNAASGEIEVSRWALAAKYYTFEVQDPHEQQADTAAKLRIDSMRFAKTDDGLVELVVSHPNKTQTSLDLPQLVRVTSDIRTPPLSEGLRNAILNDLRAFPLQTLRLECETDEVRIGDHARRFIVHSFDGYNSWDRVRTSAARIASSPRGFAVSVLSGEERSRIETIYRWNDYLGPFMPERGALSHRMDVRWDEEASQLLVGRASIYENGPQHTVVYRLQLAWDEDEQTVKVTSDARLSHFQITEHEWGSEEWLEDSIRESRIQSLAFVDGEDGRTGLKVLYADGTQTVLDVGRAQSIMQNDPARIEFRVRVADDEVLDVAIREDLAERERQGR